MSNHHFISYSSRDAKEFAFQLHDELKAGPPSIPVWLDKRDIRPGKEWDDQIAEAIRTCESLIFVMTQDSVKSKSVCKNEWSHALKYKKPVIPMLFHADAEMPFRLGSRQHIDFTGDFRTGLANLRRQITWMSSAEGLLETLKDRLEDAERDLSRAPDDEQARIKDEIAQLEKQIADQQQIIDNPEKAQKRLEESIKLGIKNEQTPKKSVTAPCAKFINPPPDAPVYFQDRSFETKLIGNFLKNDSQRLMNIIGRAGIGKTALVCRILKALENGRLPDDGGELSVDCIVYLSERGVRKVNFPNIYTDLCRLLPSDIAEKLDQVYKDPRINTGAKMHALLSAFPQRKVILLLDNFETLMNPETRNISNAEVNEALHAFLDFPSHTVKVILTTRIAPYDLAFVNPSLQFSHHMDKGLESPYAENILREMDMGGILGLKTAPDTILNEARIRTLGNPRALEALFTILSADRETTLAEILKDTRRLLPAKVVEALVGEAFSRLDNNAQRVMQAFAVYSISVTSSAIDYMLQPYMQGQDSASVLNRLVNMHIVRKDGNYYYMHPVDRDYALSRMPDGTAADRVVTVNHPFTRFALLHRGADYFKLIRSQSKNWKNINDLAPQLAEFDLRCRGEDYDTAARVLLGIDFDYLLLWGHLRLMIEMHKRLDEKIRDPQLRSNSAGNLGTAFRSVGEVRKAILYQEKALAISQEITDKREEGKQLGNLGNAYGDLGQVEKAIENYKRALDIAQEIGDRRGEEANLGNLGSAYSHLGQVERAIEHYEKALDISQEIGDRRGEGNHLGYLGNAYSDLGQVEKAIENYKRALDIAQEIGDRKGEEANLGNLGSAYSHLGQVRKAIEHYEKALAISQEIGDRRGEGANLGNLGNAYSDLGQVEKAMENFKRALDIAQEIGDRKGEEANLGNLGSAYSHLGQVKKAIEHYEKALDISQEIGDRRMEGNHLGNLGLAYSDLGKVEKAIEHYKKALAISQEIGDRRNEGNHLGNLGSAYYSLGQIEKAIEYYEKALDISQEIGDRRNDGNWLGNLGLAYSALGQVKKAIEHYQKALDISQEIGDKRGEGADLGNLGLAYYSLGQVERAIEYYEKALDISQEIGDRRGEGADLGNLGLAYYFLGQIERAIVHYQKALVIGQEIGDRIGEGNRLENLGLAYRHLGQVEKAIEHYQKALAISQEIGDRRGEGNRFNILGSAFQTEKMYREALACYLMAKKIRRDIKDPNLKTTESNIINLKEELEENEFEKLIKEAEPAAEEIVRKMLE